ncbi:MAG: GH3 auxin-responsive promoter family protein, partial [Crocinitomicaceae bacterium]
TGRTTQFINAFGEELIIDNTDKAIAIACERADAQIRDYTLAPIYMENKNKGGHEWLIEFITPPERLDFFAEVLDTALKSLNSDYEAKRSYNLSLGFPSVIEVKKGTFDVWLKEKGKLGGQHKIPRLSNDRTIIEEIKQCALQYA